MQKKNIEVSTFSVVRRTEPRSELTRSTAIDW